MKILAIATKIHLWHALIRQYFAFVPKKNFIPFLLIFIKKIVFLKDEDNIQNQVDLKIQHCSPKLYLYLYINSTNLSDSESYGTIKVDEEEEGMYILKFLQNLIF